MMAGIGVMASRVGWLFMVVSVWVFVYRVIFREEDGQKQTQGDSYRAYLKAVPRFGPALSPRVPSGGSQPHWARPSRRNDLLAFWSGSAVLRHHPEHQTGGIGVRCQLCILLSRCRPSGEEATNRLGVVIFLTGKYVLKDLGRNHFYQSGEHALPSKFLGAIALALSANSQIWSRVA
jgi:hypothetical protein